MSAIVHLGAVKKNADTAGQTGAGDATKPTRLSPSGQTGPVEGSRLLAAGLDPLESLWSGGIHPEISVGVAAAKDLVQATDSVVGRAGGLVPRLKSTVAPGPPVHAIGPEFPANNPWGVKIRNWLNGNAR
jgi:hypothetical protein